MRSLIKLRNLFVKTRDLVRDVIIMIYVIWMIRSEDLRSRIDEKICKIDMDIKDREGK
jgi:hypothetical protein